jgi:pyrroline-5-carboxylate reductase
MCLAILAGIFESLSEPASSTSKSSTPARLPSQFLCCVRSEASASRIEKTLAQYKQDVKVVRNDNVAACKAADVILLGCKPYMVNDILAVDGMQEALKGKLLISVCAGVPVEQMEMALYGGPSEEDPEQSGRCRLVRVLPNTAGAVRQSMSVIATSAPPLPTESADLITWMFECIGEVIYLAPNMMDISTALAGSAGSFFSLILEAATDGAVAMGMPRVDALKIATQAMRGVTGLVQNGEHPAVLREKASSPGGCTIAGLLVLEEAGTRGHIAKAVREATSVASLLGEGRKNVNGTR